MHAEVTLFSSEFVGLLVILHKYNHSFVFPEVICKERAIFPLAPLLNLPVRSSCSPSVAVGLFMKISNHSSDKIQLEVP